MLRIISHTDLDGVVAAALAYRSRFDPANPTPTGIHLVGYGEVDNLILQTLRSGDEPLVLDLSPQFQATADEIDRLTYVKPFLFDHHETAASRFSNRAWAVTDTAVCGARVYWDWLHSVGGDEGSVSRAAPLREMVDIANDRDLWINKNPDSKVWTAMITLCGEWGALTRLLFNPGATLSASEREAAESFLARQSERFRRAMGALRRDRVKSAGEPLELAFLGDGLLEFGDTSDFCGELLDHPAKGVQAPSLAALAYRKPSGGWAVSMRSRGGLSGRVLSLLKDGRRIRGGGHGDACALYFPNHYTEDGIRESIIAALSAEGERKSQTGVTLGDMFGGLSSLLEENVSKNSELSEHNDKRKD